MLWWLSRVEIATGHGESIIYTYILIYIYIIDIILLCVLHSQKQFNNLIHVQFVFGTSMFCSLTFSDSGGCRPADLRCNLLAQVALAAILHLRQGVLELVTSTGTWYVDSVDDVEMSMRCYPTWLLTKSAVTSLSTATKFKIPPLASGEDRCQAAAHCSTDLDALEGDEPQICWAARWWKHYFCGKICCSLSLHLSVSLFVTR